MRTSTRLLVDEAKRLLKDDQFDTEADRCRTWMERTGRSRARYYAHVRTAFAELEQEAVAAKRDIQRRAS